MRRLMGATLSCSLLLASCSSGPSQGGGSYATVGDPGGGTGGGGTGGGPTGNALYAQPAAEALSIADVEAVIARAARQAQVEGAPAIISVVDRVGNVLALFRMTGAPDSSHVADAPNGANIDLQGLDVPAVAAALAKAITGAYLSSGGNAFSTRTASMIVQQHFPPAPSTLGLESGPLFGVQFSQLPCSDLAARFSGAGTGAFIGPKRSPLGLAADPGGFPLYKNGVLVGGVGVETDGAYAFDPNILDIDDSVEERIALAGTVGFESPETIRADHVYVDGTQLRFTDARYGDLTSGLMSASYAAVSPALGQLIALIGYTDAAPAIRAGSAYGSEASGIRRVSAAEFGQDEAYILTDGAGHNRFPIRAGTDGASVSAPLTQAEVRAVMEQAFAVMAAARAQIRQPLDSRAQVSISVVDSHGQILGVVRAPDAPIFGIDVSLQKARTATFFSGADAGDELLGDPSADVRGFVGAVRSFLNDPSALTGTFAFADRSGGNLSRPHFPDGEVGRPHAPLSRPIAQFNPFSTGLQSALVLRNFGEHLAYATGAAASDTRQRCSFIPDVATGQGRLQNGIQIFPGSVPIYRGGELVGGIGVSGDGIDQDDMISFLGLDRAGAALGTINNAPVAIRADNILVDLGDARIRLRYVSCPFAPFLGSTDQNVCAGL